MYSRAAILIAILSMCQVFAQTPPGTDIADGFAKRLSDDLNVKTVVGAPIKAGATTLIPILLVDIQFGGGTVTMPGKPPVSGDAYYMSGEARPLGFVVINAKGTRFIAVSKPAGK